MCLWSVVFEFSSLEERWVWFRDEHRLARFITELPHPDSPRRVPIVGTDRSLVPLALATHSSAQPRAALTKNCPLAPEADAEEPPPGPRSPPPLPGAQGTQLRCGERPCGGGTGELSRRDHFPPRPVTTALLTKLPWGGRTGHSPWVAGRRPDPHRCRRARVPRPPRPAQVAGGLRPFPGRPRLLAPAPGRAAGSGNGAPAASRAPPPSCIGPATWPTEGAGIMQGPGKAGQGAAAGIDTGLTRLLGCPWARPAQPSPGRRGGLGVTFRRAAGSWRCRRPGGRRGRGPPPAGRRLPLCSAGPPRWRCAAARTARSRTRRGSLPSLLCLPRRPSLRSARGEARVSGCRERGGWRRVSAPQPRMMLPSAAVQVPRPAGAAAAPPVTRPRRHPLAPARARRASGPRRAVRSRLPPPLSPAQTAHRSPKPKWRVPSERGPRPRGTHRGRGCRQQRCTHRAQPPPQRRPGAPPPWRLRSLSPTRPFAAPPRSRRAWKGWRPIGIGRWQQGKALYELCTATRSEVGCRSPVPANDPCPERCSRPSRLSCLTGSETVPGGTSLKHSMTLLWTRVQQTGVNVAWKGVRKHTRHQQRDWV